MDKKGELTGDDIAYIYPDMRTALKVKMGKGLHTVTCCTQGRFENGQLVKGQMCELIGCYEVLYLILLT